MRTPLFLAVSIASLFYAADKDGAGGNATGGTLKDRLEAANGKVTELEGEKGKLSTDLDAANSKVTKLEGEKTKLAEDLATANGKVTKLEGEKSELQTKLTAAEGKVTQLEGEAKTADERAQEKAAANGHAPTPTEQGKTDSRTKDGAALYAEYSKLKGREKTAFFRANEKALTAYGKTVKEAPES